jgi:hypothetical protein
MSLLFAAPILQKGSAGAEFWRAPMRRLVLAVASVTAIGGGSAIVGRLVYAQTAFEVRLTYDHGDMVIAQPSPDKVIYVDGCLRPGHGCGLPAASRWCQHKVGMDSEATEFQLGVMKPGDTQYQASHTPGGEGAQTFVIFSAQSRNVNG